MATSLWRRSSSAKVAALLANNSVRGESVSSGRLTVSDSPRSPKICKISCSVRVKSTKPSTNTCRSASNGRVWPARSCAGRPEPALRVVQLVFVEHAAGSRGRADPARGLCPATAGVAAASNSSGQISRRFSSWTQPTTRSRKPARVGNGLEMRQPSRVGGLGDEPGQQPPLVDQAHRSHDQPRGVEQATWQTGRTSGSSDSNSRAILRPRQLRAPARRHVAWAPATGAEPGPLADRTWR